jgi:hypothetical protein
MSNGASNFYIVVSPSSVHAFASSTCVAARGADTHIYVNIVYNTSGVTSSLPLIKLILYKQNSKDPIITCIGEQIIVISLTS